MSPTENTSHTDTISRGPSPWISITRNTPPRPPRLAPVPIFDDHPPTSTILTSSSVSSPSAPDLCTDAEVDELLEGIDRVRIDDLWSTPAASHTHSLHTHNCHHHHPFPAGLFAPPKSDSAIAAINPAIVAPIASVTPVTCAHAGRHLSTACEEQRDDAPVPHGVRPHLDFPRLFKVYPCPDREACLARGDTAECFGYHGMDLDRRRPNVHIYKPHMCRFIEEVGGCRKGDRCPFSHNDFERRYHPDRFGKETCRDFLRGDCPRKYCTFRHEVSGKVEVALGQMEVMSDKELLQLVLKIEEVKGKALCEKLLRRFGHGKKHSGWKLEGFNPHGREDQKVKFVTARVEEVKRKLKGAGEKKWASSLKTSSLRDMMSGVRKVAEEVRERCRSDVNYVENGSEVHRLIRSVFSNTNWSCHSQDGDNPFIVTPENQNDAMSCLEKLVDIMVREGSERMAGRVVEGSAGNVANKESSGRRKGEEGNGRRVANNYMKMMSGGEEFGAVGDKVGKRGGVREAKRTHHEVAALWAYPSSIGQLTA